MADIVAAAAMNNVLQSEAVLSALGSSGTFTDTFWSNDHFFEIPYANGATLGSDGHADQQLAAIERFTASRPPGAATFIMDSHGTLDLLPLGYRVRIADEWFVRPRPIEPRLDERVELIGSAAALAEFEAASVAGFGGVVPANAGHTYAATLARDERCSFFGARVDGELAAGVMLFRDPQCTGVYTFFTMPDHRGRGLGSATLRHAISHAPDLPLATNPSEMSRRIFKTLGFCSVGERRIWVR